MFVCNVPWGGGFLVRREGLCGEYLHKFLYEDSFIGRPEIYSSYASCGGDCMIISGDKTASGMRVCILTRTATAAT